MVSQKLLLLTSSMATVLEMSIIYITHIIIEGSLSISPTPLDTYPHIIYAHTHPLSLFPPHRVEYDTHKTCCTFVTVHTQTRGQLKVSPFSARIKVVYIRTIYVCLLFTLCTAKHTTISGQCLYAYILFTTYTCIHFIHTMYNSCIR